MNEDVVQPDTDTSVDGGSAPFFNAAMTQDHPSAYGPQGEDLMSRGPKLSTPRNGRELMRNKKSNKFHK